jgi:hypothetical protein
MIGLASLNGRSENVRILPVVITELELGNIQRMYFRLILWNVPTTPRLKIDQGGTLGQRLFGVCRTASSRVILHTSTMSRYSSER